jgi:hypothetical protein
LESALAGKNVAEDKLMVLLKEKNSAMTLVEEHDEQLQALLKKYKVFVQQASVDAITLADQIEQVCVSGAVMGGIDLNETKGLKRYE